MPERLKLVRRGFHLAVITVPWNLLEGIIVAALVLIPLIVREGLRGECDEEDETTS